MLGISLHLSALSPSQPVIADENIICEGIFLELFAFAPQAQHSTAKPVQLAQAAKKASTRRSERNNARKQSWLEPVRRRGIYTARCVLETNEEIEICPAYE